MIKNDIYVHKAVLVGRKIQVHGRKNFFQTHMPAWASAHSPLPANEYIGVNAPAVELVDIHVISPELTLSPLTLAPNGRLMTGTASSRHCFETRADKDTPHNSN